MKVFLLRHGRTKGNLEQRYVGRTEESVLPAELARLARWAWPAAPDLLYVSPRRRCLETAEALFPGCAATVVEDFRECDFGEFEYKNYKELAGHPAYEAFLRSGGATAFPGGEDRQHFCARCAAAFEALTRQWARDPGPEALAESAEPEAPGACAVLVVHGGTVMALLERYGEPARSFYDWRPDNGGGYAADWDPVRRKLVNIVVVPGPDSAEKRGGPNESNSAGSADPSDEKEG